MARFFRLVKNEYIKVFKKLSTKIMIVLIIICALGLSGIALFAKHNMESNNYSSYDATGDYQQNIDWLKDTNGDPNEIAMWQYLIDNNIDSDDWRYDVLSAIFADGTGDMSGIKKYLDDNDWRGFCQYRLDNEILTEGEKWEYQYRLDKDISFDKSNEKKNDLIMTVANAKNAIATMGDAKSDGQNSRAKLEDNIKLALYQLDNDKLDNTANQMSLFETSEPEQITFWTVFLTSTSLVTVVALLAIVIAGGIVSSEFSQGTVKFLLINPVKRWKILMSKYFTVITVGYIMLCILFVVMIPITGLMLGFDGFSTPYIYVSGSEVKEMPTLLYAAEQYLIKSVEMVVMSTLVCYLVTGKKHGSCYRRQRIHNVHRLNGHTAFGSAWTGLGKIPCVRKHRPCFYLKGLLNICSTQPDLCRRRSYSTHGGVPTHRMGRLYKAFCIKQNKNIKRAEKFRSFFVAEKGKQMNRLSYKHKIDKGE